MSPTADAEAFNQEVTQARITDTSSGILVGVDAVEAPVETAPVEEAPKAETPAGRFTEDDLVRARQQEKEKLYPQIETLKETVARLEQERQERESAEERAKREAEERAKLDAESQTDVRDLLKQKEQEWMQQIELERQERENAFALLDREREFQAIQQYRQEQLAQAQDQIIPELADLVSGNSQEEIDASIESLRERSARILESAQSAMQSTRRDMVGARVTAPSTGPMDTQQEQQQFTPDAIRNMSINEYAKNRHRLMGVNSKSRGMFG